MAEIKLILGDCLEVMRDMPDGCVDAVVTDPPYKTEFLYVWEPMAQEAARLLKNGGLLITLAGHYALDRILPAMAKHLTYYWIGGMPNATGSVARNFSRQIMCSWKPALWFSKGKVPDHEFVFDLFATKRIERVNHKWEQPAGWFEYYIEKLFAPDAVILDPFMGSGTTGIACIRTGRNFIGIEIDETCFGRARDRIEAAQQQMVMEGMK